MRLLSRAAVVALVCCAMLVACARSKSRSPEEAFESLKGAYAAADADAVVTLLSASSVEKLRKISALIAGMGEDQQKALAARLDIPVKRLKKLGPVEYMALQFDLGKKLNEDAVREAVSYKIAGVKTQGERAVIRVENGMELVFVREDQVWKFELGDW
ncbi:MAG: hypothetical protein EPN93_10790 [Spirochaetes bacterium]|nr:MAG: hypothetical protein EPN93_10790 [Spirochaetota bacterium]